MHALSNLHAVELTISSRSIFFLALLHPASFRPMGSGFSRGTKVSDVAEEHAAKAQEVKDFKAKYPNSPIHALTDGQIEEFRAAFNSFDADGGGSIDACELETVLKSLGQESTKEELDKLIKVADTDGSGDIDFLEFVVLIAHKMKKDNGQDSGAIKTAFSFFDEDNSGASNAQAAQTRSACSLRCCCLHALTSRY